MRIVRLIFLFLLAGRICGAAPAVPPGVVVRVWQSQDGLPSNVVRSVVQSSDGYLWVATAEGLARFDGFEFELIEPEGELSGDRLAFWRLFATSGGDVLAATYQGGLLRLQQGRIESILANKRGPNPKLVTQVVEDASGAVFFKRGDKTARIHDDGSVADVTQAEGISRLFEDDLERQSGNGRSVGPEVNPVLRDRAGRIWSAGASGGLSIVENDRPPLAVEFLQRGRSFGINEMLLDREGNVWVASPVNGLARVRLARVDVPEITGTAGDRSFSSLIEDRAGVWWLANRSGGLTRWTPGASRHLDFSASRPAAALFEDRDSRLWVASRDGSVFLHENEVFLPQFSTSQVPSKVRAITQDAGGTLWFGGAQGLASLAGGRVRQFGVADGVADLTVLQPFPGGKIIAGGTDGRVLLGSRQGFVTIAAPGIMNHRWISGILPISAGEVWVSTLGSGLFLWNGKRWQGFGTNDGLPDTRLTCVLEDGKGSLWLGSLGGIIRVGRKELLARLRDPGATLHWLRLDHTDGMPSRECIGGLQPAGWKARDGQLWFPTGGGIVRVRPDLVERDTVAPPVYLQSVRANGLLHDRETGPVTTDPGRARLEFRFVGLSFGAPEKTTYRARLSGLDDSWHELGNQRVVAYEAVPPGCYSFEVMAVNGDGIPSQQPARVAVIVKPHFWQSAWFYLTAGGFVLSAAAGSGWFVARQRLSARLQVLRVRSAREAERARIARDLHDDLGASLTEISMLAALAAEDAVKTPLHPSLDQLSAKAKQAVGSLDEIVWAVNPREDTLRSLVDYLAAFAREFLDIAHIPLRVDIAPGIPDHRLAAPQRHGVLLAAREALNNIVKHSGATEVNLRVTRADGLLGVRIGDNGCGFDLAHAPCGEGLGNLRTRMQEAGGDCRIETRRGQGTTVFLTLPLPPPARAVS